MVDLYALLCVVEYPVDLSLERLQFRDQALAPKALERRLELEEHKRPLGIPVFVQEIHTVCTHNVSAAFGATPGFEQ